MNFTFKCGYGYVHDGRINKLKFIIKPSLSLLYLGVEGQFIGPWRKKAL
jgi:hypothetical protein